MVMASQREICNFRNSRVGHTVVSERGHNVVRQSCMAGVRNSSKPKVTEILAVAKILLNNTHSLACQLFCMEADDSDHHTHREVNK